MSYSRLTNLPGKIALVMVATIVVTAAILGFNLDLFINKMHLQSAVKRMQHGYERLASDLKHIETQLHENVTYIQGDDSFLASISLINNYQDKQRYNAILLDEEKKIIVDRLLNKVKFSLNDSGIVFDGNDELIAYVVKESKGYRQVYVSYDEGRVYMNSRYENDPSYTRSVYVEHPYLPYTHICTQDKARVEHETLIAREKYRDELHLIANRTLLDPVTHAPIAHIGIARHIDRAFLERLSNELDMAVSLSRELPTGLQPFALLEPFELTKEHIYLGKREYVAAAYVDAMPTRAMFTVSLDNALLLDALRESRVELILMLAVVAVIMLLLTRNLLAKWLETPLEKLMAQIRKLERQDYSESKVIATGDELETISKNVNQLARTISERESELEKSHDAMRFLSNHDALTDLPNRRYFNYRLEKAIDKARNNRTKLAVLFLDLDQFKDVNDTLGHDVGDELLVAVSHRLNGTIHDDDLLARIGGDEFNILIEDVKEERYVEVMLNKLLADFKAPFDCGPYEISSTASVGVALYPDDGEDSISLIKSADLAMYKSKDLGRNAYSFFSQDLALSIKERIGHISAIKSALENGNEFFLMYQPKIDSISEKITAIEALVRWQNPELGLVRPDQFIELAEETNLIIPLGEWILNQALKDFARLKASFCYLKHISINVSTVQLYNSDMVETVRKAYNAHHVDPEHIELEITESYIATNEKKALQTLRQFRKMHINLAIDDFGTGYSSMSYLKKLPVTRLKIDKSFIDDLPYSKENVAITKSIITLAKTFNLALTAEGVENKEQLGFLQQERCDEIQGYYYSKPLSFDELVAFCQKDAQKC